MTSITWMCFVLMGLVAVQASPTAQDRPIPQRFVYNDEALQGRGSALSTGYGPGNTSPNDYAEAGRRDFGGAQTTNEPSFLGNLARRGWDLINRGVQKAVGIGRAGINLFRNRVPAASQVAPPSVVGRSEFEQQSDYGQGPLNPNETPVEGWEHMNDDDSGGEMTFLPPGHENPNTLGHFHFRIG